MSAIDLSKAGLKVMLIEKTPYPNHKVCGEYLSNEIIPYLHTLGTDFEGFHPINRFEMSTIGSGLIQNKLGLGGIGISRHKLDNLLYIKALESQAVVILDKPLLIDPISPKTIISQRPIDKLLIKN